MKRIVVTGAAGQIAYSLLFRLAHGDLFGQERISLHLLDLPEVLPVLEGVRMELEDCAFPFLEEVKIFSDPYQAFEGVEVAFLVGAKPRGMGMERGDLLLDNAKIFIEQGKALNQVAHPNVKVLVVGNPCNTNALIALHHAPKIPRKNFQAMMRLDYNRAKSLLAKKSGKQVSEIERLVIWGNHSSSQVPDFTHVKIGAKGIDEAINDKKWLREDFFTSVQQRGSAVIAARGKSSAASAANAALDAMKELFTKTPKGDFFTGGFFSEGNPYGIEENIVFGFPCRSKGDGDWEFVTDLNLDIFIREKLAVTQKELIEERSLVKRCLG